MRPKDFETPPEREELPTCPVCGGEATKLYEDLGGEIVGCDNCVRIWDSMDYVTRYDDG